MEGERERGGRDFSSFLFLSVQHLLSLSVSALPDYDFHCLFLVLPIIHHVSILSLLFSYNSHSADFILSFFFACCTLSCFPPPLFSLKSLPLIHPSISITLSSSSSSDTSFAPLLSSFFFFFLSFSVSCKTFLSLSYSFLSHLISSCHDLF